MPLLVKAQEGHDLQPSRRAKGAASASASARPITSLATASSPSISDWTNTGDLSALEALFASLDTQDADLIVAGAFGHSRLFESLFGGVSLDLHAAADAADLDVA